MDPERRAWLTLGLAEGLTPLASKQLVEAFGAPEAVIRASRHRLEQAIGRARGRTARQGIDRADVDGVLADAEAHAQTVRTPCDDGWPTERLAPLADPPVVLFSEGPPIPPDVPSAALVGTRDASRYGVEVARSLSEDLARRGVWIVSGFAVGVDAAAHDGALAARGHTVGVLGAGLDVPYPAANGALRGRVLARGGSLISEHPPGTRPTRWSFPRRNRIVAALSDAVVVVEAPRRSGALITAGLALEIQREVLAVPGHIRRFTQRGCHDLIKDGALLCDSAADVLAVLKLEEGRAGKSGIWSPSAPAAGPAYDVWQRLDPDEAQDADSLCRATGLSPGALLSALGLLELEGFAQKVPGVGYIRAIPDRLRG